MYCIVLSHILVIADYCFSIPSNGLFTEPYIGRPYWICFNNKNYHIIMCDDYHLYKQVCIVHRCVECGVGGCVECGCVCRAATVVYTVGMSCVE